ncbi:MAG: O-antigen ligase family protein [Mariprofundaceae bacterium]|nr:O-antigen ligase family protein [Mariprofundaceae bacterium]
MTTGVWWRGVKSVFQKVPAFALILIAYLSLMPIGLLWSPDISRGIVIIGKQWSWLLLPLIIIVFEGKIWRDRLLIFLSIGLGLHLLLCIGQAYGVPLPVEAPGGSSSDDPTGLIGRIGFGLPYGIWGAWLIQWGWQREDGWRYPAWITAALAFTVIFMAQGRSGYLVAVAVLILMAWKLWLGRLHWRLLLSAAAVITIIATLIALGPAKQRLQWTVESAHAVYHGDFQHAEARWSLWYAAWEGWKQNPLLGVGTGGFPSTADRITAAKPDLYFGGTSPAHPHQMYLLDLVRWGPAGLLLLLALLWQWFRLGKDSDWRCNYYDSLISLAALGVAVHGLSAPSLEEYHSSIFATIFLALGLAALKRGVPPHNSIL